MTPGPAAAGSPLRMARDYWDAGGQTTGPQTAWKRDLAVRLLPAGARVLDVGCGTGASTPPGALGLDAEPSVLREAAGRGVRPILADITAPWPLPDASVDAVLLFDVLEHVGDPAALLAEARRVLAPGGTVLAAIPNAAHLVNRLWLLSGRTGDFTDAAHRRGDPVSDHLQRFSVDSATRLLEGAGFTPDRRFDYFPPHFSEGGWRALSPLARRVASSGLVARLPGLLAYEFLFVCAAAPAPAVPGRPLPLGGRWGESDPRYRGYRPTRRGVRLDHRVRLARDLARQTVASRVLDLGAGDAHLTGVIAAAAGAETAVAVDGALPSPLAPPDGRVSTVRADVSARLPFGDDAFDLVVCLELIEHLPDPDALLAEVARVLAPGGQLILSTPRLDGLLVIAALLLGLQPPGVDASVHRRYGNALGEGRPSGHLHLFTRRALREMLAAHGFALADYREGRFSSSWRQARRSSRRLRPRDLLLEALFAVYDLVPVRKDVMVVRATS